MQASAAIFWSLALGLIVVGLFIGGWIFLPWLRRRIQSPPAAEPEMFTLQDLREMLARGDISQLEFETMKAAILGKFAGSAANSPRPRSDSHTRP